MSKQLLPRELGEIVVGLLVNPSLLGELDTPEKHRDFMRDIGNVVAEYCGGHVRSVHAGDTDENYLGAPHSSPYLGVDPDESLPSLLSNVWSNHDVDGWDGAEASDYGIEMGDSLSLTTVNENRKKLQGLLANMALAEDDNQKLDFTMRDWVLQVDPEVEVPESDAAPYAVTAIIGNQTTIELCDTNGDPCFGLVLEIDKGVPTVHIDLNGGDSILHIHAAQGGLVLTPDDDMGIFERADADRYAYNQNCSLLIKDVEMFGNALPTDKNEVLSVVSL